MAWGLLHFIPALSGSGGRGLNHVVLLLTGYLAMQATCLLI
jgi:hypothetical protein